MLRPVREDCVEYLELVDSIREHGILNSLLVRPHPTREGYYEVIDGMWRFIASKELTIGTLPCILKVEDLTEEEFLSLQIQCNAVSYETRPVEFAEQMSRMLELREEVGAPMTLTALAKTVGKSTAWVSTRLKLLALCDEAKKLVRDGKLGLGKAVALSRIRLHKYQKEFLKQATEMRTRDFELEVGRFIALKRDEKIGGRRQERDEIKLRPRLQSMDSMLIELDRLSNVSEIIVQKNLTTALEGARIALEWVLNLHDEGREAQVRELRHKLSSKDRQDIIGRQRYEELKQLRELTQTS
jgi:ParB/RepB/Spo0J family partition protein